MLAYRSAREINIKKRAKTSNFFSQFVADSRLNFWYRVWWNWGSKFKYHYLSNLQSSYINIHVFTVIPPILVFWRYASQSPAKQSLSAVQRARSVPTSDRLLRCWVWLSSAYAGPMIKPSGSPRSWASIPSSITKPRQSRPVCAKSLRRASIAISTMYA